MHMLTMQYFEDNTVKVQQFTLVYDFDKKYGLFTPFSEIIEPPFESQEYSADATPDIIAAGCVDCNEGFGEIYLLDPQTGDIINQSILGTAEKRVGSYVKI